MSPRVPALGAATCAAGPESPVRSRRAGRETQTRSGSCKARGRQQPRSHSGQCWQLFPEPAPLVRLQPPEHQVTQPPSRVPFPLQLRQPSRIRLPPALKLGDQLPVVRRPPASLRKLRLKAGDVAPQPDVRPDLARPTLADEPRPAQPASSAPTRDPPPPTPPATARPPHRGPRPRSVSRSTVRRNSSRSFFARCRRSRAASARAVESFSGMPPNHRSGRRSLPTPPPDSSPPRGRKITGSCCA